MTRTSLPQLNARVQSLAAPGSPFELERREHTTRGLHGGPRGVRSDSGDGLSVVSLFAGIGGFDLGCTQAGMRVVAHVEKDPHCRKLLSAKWPDSVVLDDVRTAGKHNLPPCDVLCGGFPCQDLSVAGKRAGLQGERSGLFYELTRITHELQPAFLVWENVPGLLSSNERRDFLAVLIELRRIGYHGGWRTLDAQFFGVAQRRRRVFGVFARADIGAGRCAEILSLHEGVRGHPAPRREARQDVAGTLGGSSQSGGFRTTDLDNNGAFICPEVAGCLQERDAKGVDSDTKPGHLIAFSSKDSGADAGAIAPTLRSMNYDKSHINGGGQVAIAYPLTLRGREEGTEMEVGEPNLYNALKAGDGGSSRQQTVLTQTSAVRRLTPRECERLQGFPDDWTAGFADSTRYRMLGNAVAVPVARWIAARICATVAGLRGGSAWEQTGGKAELSRAQMENSVLPKQ